MSDNTTRREALSKIEHYCSYQERCHQEVTDKLYALGVQKEDIESIIVHLITNNYLNEERFARSFARGKHRIKHWGKNRIVNELKLRNISAPNIKLALSEIDLDDYYECFQNLSDRHWNTITEKNILKKRKKFCDYLLRKGWEIDLVYEKVKELESSPSSD
ncbi:MAG: regulatory protein RecX [Flavobacterium sp.]